MSITFFPDGMEIDVPNPGYGHVRVAAYAHPYGDVRPLVETDWYLDLYGDRIGEFLYRVTNRAFGFDNHHPGHLTLPKFLTVPVARDLLPSLQRAVLLAAAGTERYERIHRQDDDVPPALLCSRCNHGTFYTPGAMTNEWCQQHGHQPFGESTSRWDYAEEIYQMRRDRWDRDRQRREQQENTPTVYVMKIIGLVNGGRTSLDGRYLVEYDPTRPGIGPRGERMSAHIDTTNAPFRARRFADQAEAHAYWMRPSGRPAPADRPLTAYHVSIERPGA